MKKTRIWPFKNGYMHKKNNITRPFPKGIPYEIISEKIGHDAIIEGQVGNFVFEEREE